MTPDAAAFAAFAERRRLAAALDESLERLRGQHAGARDATRAALEAQRRADHEADCALFDATRRAMREGALRGAALVAALAPLAEAPQGDGPYVGDAPLDALLEGLLDTHGRFDGRPAPRRELIHYDPSPATLTLELARRGWFGPDTVFVDIGSGTGRVTTLAALLGAARIVAVELDPALVAVSSAAAERMGAVVEHRLGDARDVPLDDATRVFLFAPFLGPVLEQVLGRLASCAALTHVGSWGPTTAPLARFPGLLPARPTAYGPFDLATFHPHGTPR